MDMRKVDIFGVNYAVTNYSEATDIILKQAQKEISFSVFALPVYGVVAAKDDTEFSSAIDSADLIVPDGQPIKWAMNYFYKASLSDRVYGPTLTHYVLLAASKKRMKVFLYGGATETVLCDFKTYINKTYPDVIICGEYREKNIGDDTISIDVLRNTKPHMILVGLGCPVQEKWINKHKEEFNAVMIGVGAAFSFYAGHIEMAPKVMQRYGLEWLYRLYKEPKRLWKRYLFTNTFFIVLVLKECFKRIVDLFLRK